MNAIKKYFKYRQHLIDQYVKGDMSKSEYLQMNLDAVLSLNIEPFKNVDSVEKGLFNYQYYNAMAKDVKMKGSFNYAYDNKKYENDEANYYYYKKEKSTEKILKLLDYENVEAYNIEVHSKILKGKLFEIVLFDYNVILHCSNVDIKNKLVEAGVFKEDKRRSLIDGYINQRY